MNAEEGVTGCQLQSGLRKRAQRCEQMKQDSTVPGTESRRRVKVLGEVRMVDRPEEAAM